VAAGVTLPEVGPCDRCHSSLPPLLLSIAASCADCGKQVPCLGQYNAAPCCSTSVGPHASSAVSTQHPQCSGSHTASCSHQHCGSAPQQGPGHCSAHCAGCTTETLRVMQQQLQRQRQQWRHASPFQHHSSQQLYSATCPHMGASTSTAASMAASRKRTAHEMLALSATVGFTADCANNCAGLPDELDDLNNDLSGAHAGHQITWGQRGSAASMPGSSMPHAGASAAADLAACAHQHGSVFSVTAMCQGCHANRCLEVA
jgi:hypothetical protein